MHKTPGYPGRDFKVAGRPHLPKGRSPGMGGSPSTKAVNLFVLVNYTKQFFFFFFFFYGDMYES